MVMNAYDAQTAKLSELRNRAYTAALSAVRTHERLRPHEIRRLVEEMHLYQSELEKQNQQWRQAHSNFEETRARYSDLYHNAPVAYLTLDSNRRVLIVNAHGAALFQAHRHDLLGRAFADFIEPDSKVQFRAHFEQVMAAGAEQACELNLKRATGQIFPARIVSIGVHDRSGQVIQCLMTIDDLTERKHLEQELQQAQKMEAVGRLAGGLAHDFNNLLTAILGNIEWMENALKTSSIEVSELTSQLEQIDHAAQRAASLTRPLLAFSARRVETLKPLNINDVIQELETMLARLVGEDIILQVDLDPNLANIRADAGQIQQIVMNLVINARDAMPQGGSLTFKTAITSKPAALTGDTAPTGPYVMLSVADTGVGMTADVLNHIFEPFFTTKPPEKGTGLGLSTVSGIVKQAGGHISVTSEPGRGSTFEIYFPAIAEQAAAPAVQPAELDQRGSETILICEDEAMVRELTSRALRAKGYNVLVAEDSLAAANLVSQHIGPIHLLVSDVIMPGLSGHQLADLVRPDHPEMKVLFVSGYPADVLALRGINPQGAEFLEKPFTPSTLVRRVREVLG